MPSRMGFSAMGLRSCEGSHARDRTGGCYGALGVGGKKRPARKVPLRMRKSAVEPPLPPPARRPGRRTSFPRARPADLPARVDVGDDRRIVHRVLAHEDAETREDFPGSLALVRLEQGGRQRGGHGGGMSTFPVVGRYVYGSGLLRRAVR